MKQFRFRRTSAYPTGWGVLLSWFSDNDWRLVEIKFFGIQYPGVRLSQPVFRVHNSRLPSAPGPYTTMIATAFATNRARLDRIESRASVYTGQPPRWVDRDWVQAYPDGPDLL